MRAYSLLLIKTCHRRGVHAMGGMAAQIPVKNDQKANDAALAKVRSPARRRSPLVMISGSVSTKAFIGFISQKF